MKLKTFPNQPAQITVLDGSGNSFPGHIVSSVGRHLSITADTPISSGTALQVEWSQYLVLADVVSEHGPGNLLLLVQYALRLEEVEALRHAWI